MPHVTEIAPDIYRISTYLPEVNLQFNQFLVVDDEPLLFHTGMRGLFDTVREAVASVIRPAEICWIGFSHLEADECGALREWQAAAPQAEALCSMVGKLVSVDDFVSARPVRGMLDDEVLATGKYRFRFLRTPQVPHCWDAGLLFEEVNRTLFCSDLFHQNGDLEPSTVADVVGRFRKTLVSYEKGPFAGYLPYSRHTDATLRRLAALEPTTLAAMHGSAYVGDGRRALTDLAAVMREVLGENRSS
jgi:flavorubredoxin